MDVLVVDESEQVCRLRLNRPRVHNALNEDRRSGLQRELDRLRDTPTVRVVVLEGEGASFCSGIGLLSFAEVMSGRAPVAAAWVERRHALGAWQRLVDDLERLPQVTVARLQGRVVDGGVVLAAACHIRVAAEDVALHLPELAFGVPLAWGGVPRLIRELGIPLARDLVLTGRTMTASEAHRAGFVQRLVPVDDLGESVSTVVGQLLAAVDGPLAITKAMFAGVTRAAGGVASWSDPDLLGWSAGEAGTAPAAALAIDRTTARRARHSDGKSM